jgi:plasmid stabilization system protein ParE
MTLPIVLRRKAGHDLASAYNWYEDHRGNLGEQWLSAVSASFQAIAQFPEMFPRLHREIRRAIVSQFPYEVFYRVEPNRIVVLAVLHMARDPKLWPR